MCKTFRPKVHSEKNFALPESDAAGHKGKHTHPQEQRKKAEICTGKVTSLVAHSLYENSAQ